MDNIKEYKIDPKDEVIQSRKEKLTLTSLYAFVYMILLIGIVSLGTMYLNKLGYMTSNKLIPITATDSVSMTQTVSDLQMKKGSISPPVDVFAYENPSQEIIETGKQLYASNCASCHGENGAGDGPAGSTLNPPPRNFTSMEGWKNGPTIEGMYITLQDGIPNTGMAAFANLPPDQRLAIISYVRTFSTQFPPVTNADLQNLENKYKLSEGQKEPNQIPVTMAIEKILVEYAPTMGKIDGAINRINADKSPGALLLKRISSSIEKNVVSLISDNSWTPSESAFVSFVSTNPVQKGFKAQIDDFTPEEWSLLYGYLRSVINVNAQVEENNATNEQTAENQNQP